MKWTNFTRDEFACKCGHCTNLIQDDFISQLQALRTLVKIPLPISSGYRCAVHNGQINGAPNSRHMYGDAVDITWSHLSGSQKILLLRHALNLFKGIGLHKDFIHVDLRDSGTLWFY